MIFHENRLLAHEISYLIFSIIWKYVCVRNLTLKAPITTAADDKFCQLSSGSTFWTESSFTSILNEFEQ